MEKYRHQLPSSRYEVNEQEFNLNALKSDFVFPENSTVKAWNNDRSIVKIDISGHKFSWHEKGDMFYPGEMVTYK